MQRLYLFVVQIRSMSARSLLAPPRAGHDNHRLVVLLQNAAVPLIALIAGAIVCATTLALFLPLVRLIERVELWKEVRP